MLIESFDHLYDGGFAWARWTYKSSGLASFKNFCKILQYLNIGSGWVSEIDISKLDCASQLLSWKRNSAHIWIDYWSLFNNIKSKFSGYSTLLNWCQGRSNLTKLKGAKHHCKHYCNYFAASVKFISFFHLFPSKVSTHIQRIGIKEVNHRE